MIKIHNKGIYRRFYDSYMSAFIDFYCENRDLGTGHENSFVIAKIRLQDLIVTEMIQNKSHVNVILKVYTDIKKDHELYKRAIKHFEQFKK